MNLYPAGYAQLMSGSIDWESSIVRAALLTKTFQFDGQHVVLDDILESRIIAVSDALEGATEENGLFSGLPFRFAPFLDEREVSQVLIFLDGGDPAYSLLLAYWGEEELVGVPFVPQGLEYFVHPDAELGGYFRLTEDPIVGLLGTYGFGAPLSIGELEGGLEIADAALFVSGRLSVGDRVCVPADEPDSCCRPTFRGSLCE